MRSADFALRLAFFAIVPFLATWVSALFPMTAVLVNVAITLAIFATAEAIRERAERSPLLARAVKRHLAFEAHYRENPPRQFLFYVFYPLLLPYVLFRADMRRELCIFLFLLPIATTVVKLHAERRFKALWILFGTAALSVTVAVVGIEQRHGHLVSWVTTQRVRLRTKSAPSAAKAAQLQALKVVWANAPELKESTDAEGWVEGDALDRAEEQLAAFYKADEAYAFSLHALPAGAPEVLLLQCDLGKGPPVWRALKRSGAEITSIADLPHGVLGLARRTTVRPPKKRVTGWRNVK
jgi:type IV secretory pathway TrbD component